MRFNLSVVLDYIYIVRVYELDINKPLEEFVLYENHVRLFLVHRV